MNKLKGRIYSIFIRYFILVLTALPNFWIFYFIFTPLTVYPVYFLFRLFFEVSLSGHTFIFADFPSVEVIDACVAGSAYYLLLILNLALPNIKFKKRIKMILISFAFFLLANIIRIFVLSLVFFYWPDSFDISHKITWYFGSIILVVAIWFIEVKKFNIKEIPFYSDLKFIYKKTK